MPLPLLLSLMNPAIADGVPQNALGLSFRAPAQADLDGFAAIQVSRRVTQLPAGIDLALDPVGRSERDGWWVSGAITGDQIYGIGAVPAICDDAALRTAFECPRGDSTRPVPIDGLQSSLAVGVHRGDVSFIYTGRITQLQIEPRPLMRQLFPQVFTRLSAPLLPANIVLDRTGVTKAIDYPRSAHLLAVAWHPDAIDLRVGLSLEGRLYAHVAHPDTGLMIETLLRRNITGAKSLTVGTRRLALRGADAGQSTLLLQRTDLVDIRTLERNNTPTNLDTLGQIGLWQARAAHEDIVGVVDVRAGVAVQPNIGIHEASVGLHTVSWLRNPGLAGAKVRLGVAGTPVVPGYSVKRIISPMATVAGRVPLGEIDLVALDAELGFNNPDWLPSVPTAVGAVSAMLRLSWPGVVP